MKLIVLTVLVFNSALLLMVGVKFNMDWLCGVGGFGLSTALMGAWFK